MSSLCFQYPRFCRSYIFPNKTPHNLIIFRLQDICVALGYNITSGGRIEECISKYQDGINRMVVRAHGVLRSSENISTDCPPTGNSQMQTLPLQHQWELTRTLHLETEITATVAQITSPPTQIACTSAVSLPDQPHSSMPSTNTNPALFRDSKDSSPVRLSPTFLPTRNTQTPSAGKPYFA